MMKERRCVAGIDYAPRCMEGFSPFSLPPGFRTGTVAARTIRHLIPPSGRFGICGAPVAPETIAARLAADDRVCPHCIDRVVGKKPPAPQPLPKKLKPVQPSQPAPAKTVTVEVPSRVAAYLQDFLEPIGSRETPKGRALRYVMPVEQAKAVAEVLDEVGVERESARIIRAALLAASSA
jgi:hypothetical protein